MKRKKQRMGRLAQPQAAPSRLRTEPEQVDDGPRSKDVEESGPEPLGCGWPERGESTSRSPSELIARQALWRRQSPPASRKQREEERHESEIDEEHMLTSGAAIPVAWEHERPWGAQLCGWACSWRQCAHRRFKHESEHQGVQNFQARGAARTCAQRRCSTWASRCWSQLCLKFRLEYPSLRWERPPGGNGLSRNGAEKLRRRKSK